jgi:hypothetical protein
MVTPISKVKQNQRIKNGQGISSSVSKRLYTAKEAMRELIWAGRIPVVRTEGGRKIFLDILDLTEFIDQNKSIYQ